MEIGLALASALLFALGSVLQQRAGVDAPSAGTHAGLLLRMARRPVWLAGIASDVLGFVAQAAALGVGLYTLFHPGLRKGNGGSVEAEEGHDLEPEPTDAGVPADVLPFP